VSPLATMAGALLYLRVTSLVGQVRSRLRRLQQPKYLAGALVGAAYVYLTFIRRAHGVHPGYRPGAGGPGIPPEALALLPEVGALLLLIAVLANWVVPRRAALAFSEAEIAFLFPAPVNRRMLVHYRLLGSQLGIVFSALILTVIFGRGRAFGGNPWFHALGWWLILAVLNLHFTGTSFVYSKLLNRSVTSGRQRATLVAVVLVATCALIAWAWRILRLPGQGDFRSLHAFSSYVVSQLHVGPLPWLLAIPRVVLAPYFAGSGQAFLLALGPALVVLVAHYFWVVYTEVSFEEASIARAEKRATRVQRVQQGDWRGQSTARKAQRAPFNLAQRGRPEVAFLWKNLLSTSAFYRPRVAIAVVAIIVAGSEWLVHQPGLEGPRFAAMAACGFLVVATLLLGPMTARQDLRADLPNSDILKTYPLHGWQVVIGELLTPLTILTVSAWIYLLAVFLLFPGERFAWFTLAHRSGLALGVAVLAPPFIAIQCLVPNAAAVVFPAWAQLARDRTERGIEVMGQRIILVAGQLLVTAIAVVPAAIGAALVFLLTQWLLGIAAGAALAVVAVFMLLGVEFWLGIRWLGTRFEQFDLSAELRP
jgi:ABC-2 type transport system permease protein